MNLISGAVAGGEAFSEENRDILVNDIFCFGNESSWIDCDYNVNQQVLDECGPFEDAYVACQGMPAMFNVRFLTLCM